MKYRIFSIVLSMALLFYFAGGTAYSQTNPNKKDSDKATHTQVSTTNKTDNKDKNIETAKSKEKYENTQKIETKGNDTKEKEMTNMTKEKNNKMSEQKHNQQHTTTTKEKEKEVKSPTKENVKKQQIK